MVFRSPTFHGSEPQVETDHSTRATLEEAVCNALGVAGGIDACDVVATVDGDEVFLDGFVGTVAEIERAAEVAQSVEGVRSVQNRILLSTGGRG
jgi:osmotically-inducible protein OsmY